MCTTWPARRAVLLLVTGLLVACGGDGEAVVSGVGGEANPTSSTDRAADEAAVVTSSASSSSSIGVATTAPATTTTLVSEGSVDTSAVIGTVVDDLPFFTTPSGNIACSIGELHGVSCWISEKEWEIEMPADDFCEIADWGNALVVDGQGVSWLCYTDFPWDPSAPPLAYGEVVEAGGFRCLSERSGLTCTNEAGSGFTLARAAVDVF